MAEKKLQLTEIQKECYEVELKNKKEEAVKNLDMWEKQKKILEVELMLKNEEYNELIEERQRKKKLFELIEEEQKLKIDILKCELNTKLTQSVGMPRPK